MPNGITLRVSMRMYKLLERECLYIHYGPKTVSKEAFFALAGTPEYKAALKNFANEYAQFLKQQNPTGRVGGAL